jgi:integration host factor subunit beta
MFKREPARTERATGCNPVDWVESAHPRPDRTLKASHLPQPLLVDRAEGTAQIAQETALDGATMTRSQLVRSLAQAHPSLHESEVEKVVTTFLDRITAALACGDRVELRDFGTFSVRRRDARIGRNPRTGDSVPVTEKRVPFFKAGRLLHARLNPN